MPNLAREVSLSLTLYLLVLTICSALCRAECPQEELIEPCNCSNIDFRCDKPELNSTRLREIFRVKLIGRKAIRQLYIHSTNLTELRPKQFGDFKIGRIYLDHNNIKKVEPSAFISSHETLSDLSMSSNDLVEFPWNDIKFMRKLERLFLLNNLVDINDIKKIESKSLRELNLGANLLYSPVLKKGLFEKLNSLESLILRANRFEVLSRDSLFVDSKNRVSFDLSDNIIGQIDSGTFGSNMPKSIDLSRNNVKLFNETTFKPLLVNGTKIDMSENPIDCTDCETNKWIVDDKAEDWMLNLLNFRCSDGTTLKDLTFEIICPTK